MPQEPATLDRPTVTPTGVGEFYPYTLVTGGKEYPAKAVMPVPGATAASSPVFTDANRDVSNLRNVALTGTATHIGARFQGGAAGAVGSLHEMVVRKTGIADNTATDIITVTVPNAEVNAGIFLEIIAHLGTGTDNSESTRVATGVIAVARKTGDATVGVASTLAQTAIATTSGGGTITLAYAVSAIAGAAGAVNTFTITLTIVKTGTITDHTAMVVARLANSSAAGITMVAA